MASEAGVSEAVATATEVAGLLTPPPNDEEIPAFLDRRPLSADDQRVFDVIMAALARASAVVRERVRAELIRPNAWSGSAAQTISNRRHDNDASAIPNQPTVSELAQTAGGADASVAQQPEPAGDAPLVATPAAADAVGAGIKYRDLDLPGFMPTRARPIVVVRRKSRRPKKKPRGPFETSPF